MTARLDQVLARARAAVLDRGVLDSTAGSGTLPIAQGDATDLTVKVYADEYYTPHSIEKVIVESLATVRPVAAPAPMVRSSYTPSASAAPSWPSCEAVTEGRDLSRGCGRVWRTLHRLACDVAKARAYVQVPDVVVFHLPASLLALGVGYTDRHLRRLLPELEAAGLLAYGAHAGLVNDYRLWDGCLWAVKVSASEIVPRIRREDWRHHWRDFAGDIRAGRTVKALLEGMSGLQAQEQKNAVQDALKAWAVNPGNLNNPVACSTDIGLDTVQDLRQMAYRVGDLGHVHPDKRSELVGRTASALARLLDDPQSRRWYCRLLWEALKAEREGRGGLGVLSAALVRLETDRVEWSELKRPAALLASRLQSVV